MAQVLRHSISQMGTREYPNITCVQIEACANWEYPKVAHVQIEAHATRALWDRCRVAQYIIPFGDSQALFSLNLLFLLDHHRISDTVHAECFNNSN